MFAKLSRSLFSWMRRAITRPRDELDRWQRAARFVYDLLRYGAVQLKHDRATQLAAALAFRSLFALFPVLIVGMIVINAIQGDQGFIEIADQLFKSLHLDEVTVAAAGESTDAANNLAEWLHRLVLQVASINLAAVGWVGFALIVYAAVGLMIAIENAFNTIYRAPHGRPWMRRLPLYWFVLTVAPIAMGVMWYIDANVASWIDTMPAGNRILLIAKTLWQFGCTWLIFLMIYTLLPNTHVQIRPAAVGALIAAILFAVGERTLGIYLQNAFSVNQLYGSLGLVPLFMFWSYLMWLGVLFGLEVSAALQALKGRQLEELQPSARTTSMRDPAVIFSIMGLVTEDFAAGRSTSTRDVADTITLPASVVETMFHHLVQRGFLHWVGGEEDEVCLARVPEQIPAADLMDVAFQLVDAQGGESSGLVDRLRQAQTALLSHESLAGVVAAG